MSTIRTDDNVEPDLNRGESNTDASRRVKDLFGRIDLQNTQTTVLKVLHLEPIRDPM
jgi:hypothetical protein